MTILLGFSLEAKTFLAATPVEEMHRLSRYNDFHQTQDELEKIKFMIVNGHTHLARFLLENKPLKLKEMKPVQQRYLALAYFIQGDYEKSLELIKDKELDNLKGKRVNCLLQTINEMMLRKPNVLETWSGCKQLNHSQLGLSLLWPETLVSLAAGHPTKKVLAKTPLGVMGPLNINYLFKDNEELKRWIKLALYLNQEKTLYPLLPHFASESYQDPEIRELFGLICFRMKEFKQALDFVSDLNSANAENIKGNIYLKEGKLELALGHFLVALKRKANSQNALERAIGLSFELKDFKLALKLLAQYSSFTKRSQDQRKTLMAMAYIELGKNQEAKAILDDLYELYHLELPDEIQKVGLYNALILNQKKDLEIKALRGCQNFDAVSCWTMFSLERWESLPLSLKREEPFRIDTTGALPELRADQKLGVDEEIFINQQDIDELDDADSKLILITPPLSPGHTAQN